MDVVVDEVVVVEDVATEVVVVEDVVLGGSEGSGSSDGAEEAAEAAVDAEVELALLAALVLVVVIVAAAVTAGSDASSAPNTDGEPCAPATLSAASVVDVAASDCVIVAVTPPAPAAVVAGLLSLPDEQATANRATLKNTAVLNGAGFEVVIANLLL